MLWNNVDAICDIILMHLVTCPHSLKDILLKKRMERQLAAARGLGPMGEAMPGEGGEGGGIAPAGSKVGPAAHLHPTR